MISASDTNTNTVTDTVDPDDPTATGLAPRDAEPSPRWSATEIARALGAPDPTSEQCAVIEAPMVSMLVVAGAGSGKTETMAARVLWLVANGHVRPDEVLGLTFTRKASIELSIRLSDKIRGLASSGLAAEVPDPASESIDAAATGLAPTVSTYHAYAGRIVAEHGLRRGVEPHVRLLSQAACWQIAHEVVTSHTGEMDGMDLAEGTVVQAVLDVCGELNEHLVEPEAMAKWLLAKASVVEDLPGLAGKRATKEGRDLARTLRKKALIVPLVHAYREAKARRGVMDFSDQMAVAAALARDCPEVARSERHRYKVVLLDEFQDTSEAQMVLLASLFGSTDAGEAAVPVVAVGDPHQSIYGWRGASATTLRRFPRRFGSGASTPTPVVSLSMSWRNSGSVLKAANAVAEPLRRASAVPVPELRAAPGSGVGQVDAIRAITHIEESAQVADWIRGQWFTAEGAWSGRSAAVLCRSRAQFDTVVPALREAGLPVEVVGLGGLLNAPELVDLVALLWAVQEPSRGEAVIRLVVGPVCRLGAADLDALWSWARELVQDYPDEEASLGETLDHLPRRGWVSSSGKTLSEAARGRLMSLGHAISRVRSLVGLPLPDLLVEAERSIGLDIEVAADPDVPHGWGRAHLDALIDIASNFVASADRPTLGGFLAWLEAARAHERALEGIEIPELAEVNVSTGSVQVLTVHAAKGLEWDVVAVPGLADGIFPVLRGTAKFDSNEADGGDRDEPPHDPEAPCPDRRATDRQGFLQETWSFSAYAHRGWLTGIGSVPYALRGDKDGLPMLDLGVDSTHALTAAIAAVSADGVRHREMEERRLAYVALTRARNAMLLSAPVWSTGKNPRITSRFLADVLADPDRVAHGVQVGPWAAMPQTDAETNPLAASEERAPWPVAPGRRRVAMIELVDTVMDARAARPVSPEGSNDAYPHDGHANGEARKAVDPHGVGMNAEDANIMGRNAVGVGGLDPELVQMLLSERRQWSGVESGDVASEIPDILSTSALLELAENRDRFLRRQRRPLPTPPSAAAETGTRLHAWIEQHYARPTLWVGDLPGQGAPGTQAGPGAAVEDTGGSGSAEAALAQDMQENFLDSQWADRTPVEIELSITTRLAGRAVRGRIDAVFERADGGYTVVDWKSGPVPSAAALSKRAMQLEVYRLAYARLRGVPASMVDAAFYFAATGETIWPTLPTAASLESKLNEMFVSSSPLEGH
ncbi:MAG: ATP-dependent DNA helicase [Ornithinimicrobium sp.]